MQQQAMTEQTVTRHAVTYLQVLADAWQVDLSFDTERLEDGRAADCTVHAGRLSCSAEV